MFALKKAVSSLIFPVPVILIILGITVILLWRGKRSRSAAVLGTAAFLALGLSSFPPVADCVLGSLEQQYEVFDPASRPDFQPQWIVILGGGFARDSERASIHRISMPSLARVVEGIRLYHHYPDVKLLLSGGARSEGLTGARIMYDVATQLGMPAERMVLESRSLDTDDQSRNIRSVVGDSAFVLVTSASHMPRAMALFAKQRMHPVPAPTGFKVSDGERKQFESYVPSSSALFLTRTGIYERLGILWSRIRGHI